MVRMSPATGDCGMATSSVRHIALFVKDNDGQGWTNPPIGGQRDVAPEAMTSLPEAVTSLPEAVTLLPGAVTLLPEAVTLLLGAVTLLPEAVTLLPGAVT